MRQAAAHAAAYAAAFFTAPADQVIDFMLSSLERGDFYILCPDNDVTRQMDEKRLQWTTDDIIRNRPALSRWRPEFAEAFARHMEG